MDVQPWGKILCATVMELGAAAGAGRVMRSLGVAAYIGAPLPKPRTSTGAIVGFSAAPVRSGLGGPVTTACRLTLPMTALVAQANSRLLNRRFGGAGTSTARERARALEQALRARSGFE